MKYKIQEKAILGKPLPNNLPIRIVGAGISGLFAGFYLQKLGVDFEIIELSDHAGGLLGTKQGKFGLMEQAANGFIWCPEIQELADDLGLEIIGPQKTAKKRFLVRNGQLRRYPLGIGESMTMAGKAMLPHSQHLKTAADFGEVYFGKAFAQQLLEPGLMGIYGANPEDLSFSGALARVAKIMNESDLLPLALLKSRGKTPKPAKKQPKSIGTHSFSGGMKVLVERLADQLKAHIRYGVNGLDYKDQSDPLLLTCPAHQSKQFFSGRLAEMLGAVQYTPMVTTTLFFKRAALPLFQDGFGCLIPRNEGPQILGVLFNSCIFPNRSTNEDILSLTCMLRDESPEQELQNATDPEIIEILLRDLKTLFGLKGEPLEFNVFRWPKAIPLYSPDLYENWFEMDKILQEDYPNRHLFGNYTSQISVRGMCQAASRLKLS